MHHRFQSRELRNSSKSYVVSIIESTCEKFFIIGFWASTLNISIKLRSSSVEQSDLAFSFFYKIGYYIVIGFKNLYIYKIKNNYNVILIIMIFFHLILSIINECLKIVNTAKWAIPQIVPLTKTSPTPQATYFN